MASIRPGGKATFKNEASGLYMNVNGGSTGSSSIIQWDGPSKFLVLPVEPGGNRCWIAADVSGLPLHLTPDGHLNQDIVWNNPSDLTSQWELEDSGGDTCWIKRVSKAIYVHPGLGDWLHKKGNTLWATEEGRGADYFNWEVSISEEGNFPDIHQITHAHIPDVERLATHHIPAERTAETLVGQVAVPFLMINDRDRVWQANHSSYYIISRYGYWDRVFFYEHSETSTLMESQETTVGVVSTNAKEIERTTNFSVNVECGFSFKGASASVGASVSKGLRVSQTTSTTTSSSVTRKVEREFKDDGKKLRTLSGCAVTAMSSSVLEAPLSLSSELGMRKK
jgi:hypothetical protein